MARMLEPSKCPHRLLQGAALVMFIGHFYVYFHICHGSAGGSHDRWIKKPWRNPSSKYSDFTLQPNLGICHTSVSRKESHRRLPSEILHCYKTTGTVTLFLETMIVFITLKRSLDSVPGKKNWRCASFESRVLLKSDSGYPKDEEVTVFTLANPGKYLRFNTHWSAPPLFLWPAKKNPPAKFWNRDFISASENVFPVIYGEIFSPVILTKTRCISVHQFLWWRHVGTYI